MGILNWAGPEDDLGPDTALEEYKQQLWGVIGACRDPADRRILLRELERLNQEGRKALPDHDL